MHFSCIFTLQNDKVWISESPQNTAWKRVGLREHLKSVQWGVKPIKLEKIAVDWNQTTLVAYNWLCVVQPER